MLDTTFITINPHILGGTPVFAGTRVPVRILFEYIETGETLAEFLDEFPSVSRELAQGVLQEAKQAVVHAHSAWRSRYRESLSVALPGHFVRTVQLMGWSGLVNGKLLAAAAGVFNVLITGDRNMQYQQSASQLPMSVVVLIAPNHKLESFLPLVGKLLGTFAALQEPTFIQLKAE